MGLFDKFQNTIFVKDTSELETKIQILNEIKDKVVEKEEIEKDIKLSELGLIGENRIKYELRCANIGMYVLHDVNIIGDDLSAQIDWVVITPAHCYLIECKNLIGNVSVNSEGEFRRYYQYKGKQINEAIYSPYRQAVRHKEILKKNWRARHNKVEIFLRENGFENYYKPLVVFANPNGILNIKYAPKEIKKNIVKVDNLIEYLKNDIAREDKDVLDNKKEMEKAAKIMLLEINTNSPKDYTKKYTIIDEKDEQKGYMQNKEQYKEQYKEPEQIKDQENNITENGDIEIKLREKLINYRKEKSKKSNGKLPAYYIFTNEELEKLIKQQPKNMNELRDSKILSSVKVKCHGEEVVKIISDLQK